MLPIVKFKKKAAQDLVDLMDARKKSISGSLDENPELKSKWEKVFHQGFFVIGLSMTDDNNFLLRIMIIMSEGELRPRNQVIPSTMRRGSTSTGSKGASWRKGKLGNDKLGKMGKDSDDNSAEESSDKTPLTVRNIQVLVLLLITR